MYDKSLPRANYSGIFNNELSGALEFRSSYRDFLCPCDCAHFECAELISELIPNNRVVEVDPSIKYQANNLGYRSDDFTPNIGPDNFLFSGCSNTLGVGLPYESVWAYQLNHTLGGKTYLNLSTAGASTTLIISEVYKFIEAFGKPKALFLVFPNLERHVFITKGGAQYRAVSTHWLNNKQDSFNRLMPTVFPFSTSMYYFYVQVRALEQYCEALGVPLFWSNWDYAVRNAIIKHKLEFKNYVHLDDYKEAATDKDLPEGFSLRYEHAARDLSHFGSRWHYWIHNVFLERYNDATSKKN